VLKGQIVVGADRYTLKSILLRESQSISNPPCYLRRRPLKVFAIGGRAFVAGMKIAGVDGTSVENKDEALEVIRAILARKDIGLILLSSRLSKEIRVQLGEIRKKHPIPLIYELPEPGGGFEKVEYRELVKQILGV
jgi:vacuolar-type H+-ATPase subunit F/Vma7